MSDSHDARRWRALLRHSFQQPAFSATAISPAAATQEEHDRIVNEWADKALSASALETRNEDESPTPPPVQIRPAIADSPPVLEGLTVAEVLERTYYEEGDRPMVEHFIAGLGRFGLLVIDSRTTPRARPE